LYENQPVGYQLENKDPMHLPKFPNRIISIFAVILLCSPIYSGEAKSQGNCEPANSGEFFYCDLRGVDWSGENLMNSDFSQVDLSGANLTGANLSGSILNGAQINGANLDSANLSGADLTLANFENSSLISANLSKTNLHLTNFRSADLNKSNLSYAKFEWTTLGNANMSQVKLAGAVIKNKVNEIPSKLPSGFRVTESYLLGPGLDLSKIKAMGKIDISNLDLSLTKLSGMTQFGSSFYGFSKKGPFFGKPKKLPKGWRAVHGFLLGPGITLTGADLSYLKLDGINLSGSTLNVYLIGSSLVGARFSNSNISFSNFSKANLTSALFDSSNCGAGCIFNSSKLNGANVNKMKFGFSSMKNLVSSRLIGKPASLPAGYCLKDKSIKRC
jgi:uncharacterized protein YjbI with pentapeptide repeats